MTGRLMRAHEQKKTPEGISGRISSSSWKAWEQTALPAAAFPLNGSAAAGPHNRQWLTIKEDRRGQKPERLILRGEGEALCRARRDERCGTGISPGGDGPVIRRLLQQGRLYIGSFSAGLAPSGFLRSGTRTLHGCSPQLFR